MSGLRGKLELADPVAVTFPSWIGGEDPAFLQQFCRWSMTPPSSGGEPWMIQTQETLQGDRPDLLGVKSFGRVSTRQSVDRYAAVMSLAGYDHVHPVEGWPLSRDLDAQVAASEDRSIFSLIASARGLMSAAPSAAVLQSVLPSIAEHRLRPILPSASVWLLRTSDVLAARYTVARAMLRETADSAGGLERTRNLTRASAELFPETNVGLSAYLGPLLACLSPWVWGTTAARGGGVLMILFGTVIPGEDRSVRGLLDTLAPARSTLPTYNADTPTAEGMDATARWWVKRLDLVFGEATNLSNYLFADSAFSPPRMLEKLLNLEQCFRHCQALAASQADDHSRRVLTFTALEAFGGVTPALGWEKTYSLPVVSEMLHKLEQELPPRVATVLLPRARRGVAALREVQDGFFDWSRRESDSITLTNRKGKREPSPLHAAVKAWLRVLRNSHHGFDNEPSARDRDLLALHDGRFPAALADLLWLVLVYLLAFPEIMRHHPRPGGPRATGRSPLPKVPCA